MLFPVVGMTGRDNIADFRQQGFTAHMRRGREAVEAQAGKQFAEFVGWQDRKGRLADTGAIARRGIADL
ncbi:hypothetical protein D3C87_2018500 [compost metagenome]